MICQSVELSSPSAPDPPTCSTKLHDYRRLRNSADHPFRTWRRRSVRQRTYFGSFSIFFRLAYYWITLKCELVGLLCETRNVVPVSARDTLGWISIVNGALGCLESFCT